MTLTLEAAQALDRRDPLARYRDHFAISDPELIYLDGNSLGRMPRATLARLHELAEQWGEALIRGWNQGWYEAPQRIGEAIAPLVGAAPGQVIAGDSTSLNLYKATMAALALRPERTGIVSDAFNFPTDLYVTQGCIHTLGGRHNLHLVPSEDGLTIPSEAILAAISEETALVTLTHVAFKSGWMHDAARISAHAQRQGALVLWDLSHSVGAVPVALDEWGADFAVGCTYKYLNGGPGAPAFLYVAMRHHAAAHSPIWGWFGQRHPFAFELDYEPAEGIARFLVGTPPILSLLAVEPALALMNQVGIAALREKSVALSEFLIALADERLVPLGFSLGSPRAAARRGSHLSLRHPQAYQINQALIAEMKVLPDFREPDNLRLGLAPLYNSFAEMWEAVERLACVVREGRHEHYPEVRQAVT